MLDDTVVNTVCSNYYSFLFATACIIVWRILDVRQNPRNITPTEIMSHPVPSMFSEGHVDNICGDDN